jgi:hypothetical protein
LVVFSGIATLAFIFFPDSWRRERSAVFQSARVHALMRIRSERAEHQAESGLSVGGFGSAKSGAEHEAPDLEKVAMDTATRARSKGAGILEVVGEDGTSAKIRIGDCNPFPLVWKMASTPQNAMVVVASGESKPRYFSVNISD